jgi:uncharacterized protein (TIGR02680 family)
MLDQNARWKPARAGIRNIWEYDDQVFEFADGRLVLRGPNGSGKSNALALFVPFLLDGVMSASRMDSLGGGRSMKSLLLCLNDDERAKRFRHEHRTGYAWLEFERGGEHITIGCGARVSTQRDAEAWFFVTPRRPGIDLDLAPDGIPLSRGALVETLGARAIHDSAEAYRAAVDKALFGLGAHRYRNLVELLLVLRRPHLAGKLNLEHLSKVLSDGLASLDDRIIADVAASFEDLEAVQRDLRRLQDAYRTVQVFLPVYRRYLRAAGRARALVAADAERAVRAARRRVTDAEKGVSTADAELEQVRLARVSANERREVAEQRHRAILESPAYLDAKSLVEVEGRAADAEAAAARAGERLTSAEKQAEHAAWETAHTEAELRAAATGVDQAFAASGETADQAGVAWPIARDGVEAGDLQKTLRALGVERRQDIAEVRAALTEATTASVRASEATSAAARSGKVADDAEGDRQQAAAAVDAARGALAGDVQHWIEHNDVAGLGAVLDAVEPLGEPDAPTLTDVLAGVLRPLRDRLAARDARAADRMLALAAERSSVIEHRQRIADDPVPAPDRLPTRPANRAGRAGAPLYACVDFAEHVPADDRAGLEAAIEAAGLLDAWIGETSEELDAWLGPGSPVESPRLADVLVATPPDASPLDAGVVHDVLASIALADVGVAMLPDGRFHLGPLYGRFAKPTAEFIGATAREHRRQRLLAELDQRIAELMAELDAVGKKRQALAAEQSRLDEIAESLPPAESLLAARDALLRAVATAQATRRAADRDALVARGARNAADQAHAALRARSVERRLPATGEGLSESERVVHAYEQRANDLVTAVARLVGCRAADQQASARLARARSVVTGYRQEHDELRRRSAGIAARVAQLRSQLGADAEAPLRALEAVESELHALRDESERLDLEAQAAARQQGDALREQKLAIGALDERIATAAEAASRLDVLRRADVWPVVAQGHDIPTARADLAAAVVTATADVSPEPDDNALQRAYRQLLDELGRDYDPGLSYVDHVGIVEVTSDTGTFSVFKLADELGGQVASQQKLLTERDREIFERHLLTRVSEGLRRLLNDANELVECINRSLAQRPTASGKTVRLRWEADSTDPAVRTALGLLRKTPELLGPDEREQLRRFFSTAIAQRRAEDAAAGYAEILRYVLDYRAWHTFVPHVRSAGGGIQRLTRTLFRTLSGGEQAVVLHLPLFAAASAHYDTAGPFAPRMIALDEAFAGIDEGMRAELMGLLVRFDLDVLLTGHELWGAYEQVPTLMVYDLLRHPPLEGVSAFAVQWDGATMAEV